MAVTPTFGGVRGRTVGDDAVEPGAEARVTTEAAEASIGP